MISAVLLMLLPALSAQAVSLLRIGCTPVADGELVTLHFDEDLPLVQLNESGKSIQLTAASAFFNDAVVPQSRYIQSIEVAQSTLSLMCSQPVTAGLRRAGAGVYLLLLRADSSAEIPATRSRMDVAPQVKNESGVPIQSDKGVSPPDGEELLSKARGYALEGRTDEARVTIESIPDSSRAFPWGRLLLGELDERTGNPKAARGNYEKALEHPETASAAAASLALLSQKQGDSENAEKMWEQVLQSGDSKLKPFDGDFAQVPPGETTPPSQVSSKTRRSTLKLQPSQPVEFFNTRLMILITVIIIALGGLSFGVVLLRRRLLNKKKNAQPADEGEDEVYWKDDREEIRPESGDRAGLLETELAGEVPSEPEALPGKSRLTAEKIKPPLSEPKTREKKISEETRKEVVTLHKDGNTVREIAEITGKSQDEIRMALQLEGVTAEA